MSYFRDEAEEAFGKKAVSIGVTVIVVMLIITGITAIFGLWPFSVAKGVINKVANAERIVNQYEWFFDQYAAIQAQEANVNATSPDSPNYAGMVMVLNNSISEYNARSKEISRNIWKSDELPYQINFYERK